MDGKANPGVAKGDSSRNISLQKRESGKQVGSSLAHQQQCSVNGKKMKVEEQKVGEKQQAATNLIAIKIVNEQKKVVKTFVEEKELIMS